MNLMIMMMLMIVLHNFLVYNMTLTIFFIFIIKILYKIYFCILQICYKILLENKKNIIKNIQ